MQCPLCNTEMRIKSSDYVTNGSVVSARMILTCRNKQCANFGKDVKTIYTPLNTTVDSEAPSEVTES